MRPLRIFLCCQQAKQRHDVPAYGFWAEYFLSAFSEAGHTAVEAPSCDWAEGLLPLDPPARAAWLDRTWSAALAFLREEHARQPVDLFLSYLFPHQVLAPAVDEICRLGIPCVNFFCDNVREFRAVPEVFRPFTLHWVPEFKALPLYERAGLPSIHAPMACWIDPVHRAPVEHESRPVTFWGTRDEQREVLFAEAIRRGLELELVGSGWISPGPSLSTPAAAPPGERLARQWRFLRSQGVPAFARKIYRLLRPPSPGAFDFSAHTRQAMYEDEYWPTLREARVCLGVNRYPSLRFPFDRPDTYSRLRDIEAPMAGACYLTEWTDGLDQLYDLTAEIETYRSAEELVAKAQALSADAPRRHRMRLAAQRRALHEHSIAHTIERIAVRVLDR
ncbi:MAG: glycosyltransferase [Opitutales bacterium]